MALYLRKDRILKISVLFVLSVGAFGFFASSVQSDCSGICAGSTNSNCPAPENCCCDTSEVDLCRGCSAECQCDDWDHVEPVNCGGGDCGENVGPETECNGDWNYCDDSEGDDVIVGCCYGSGGSSGPPPCPCDDDCGDGVCNDCACRGDESKYNCCDDCVPACYKGGPDDCFCYQPECIP